ncbi:DUF2075 domain-containing protein [Nocardioides sp. Soil796]|uniref:DUF2075 domain-containing protein n=1 Tax=Nocardioides sp. Soil796 TaxID=1736412 RepID=UPI000708A041|nr:DUF2075 domain-containing protein [Nocardioides sp. Soil796]KRF11030.1 AAA family ATPase [Nocardioides sp. Soil796]
MTAFRIEEFAFDAKSLATQAALEPKLNNWPVVYTLDAQGKIYVGESINAAGRLRNHLDSPAKRVHRLQGARVVIGERFNKSACLDLESYLIRLLAGDGQYEVLNRNEGITRADYFDRDTYQRTFAEIFEELRRRGVFTRSISEIENSDLFKLSPFKALSVDQTAVVEGILDGLFDDLSNDTSSRIVIQGDPGTGKTVVAIYLMKLLADIQAADPDTVPEGDSVLSEFFVKGYRELLQDFKVGLVVPQQSLRLSVKRVFRKTPGLSPKQVLSPFQVVSGGSEFDLLIVDEAHRLNQRAAQAAGPLNRMFSDHNRALFGDDDPKYTQVDWINRVSRHQIYLVDGAQAIRPADLSEETLGALVATARHEDRHYRLHSQMRVQAGQDYVRYVRGVLSGSVFQRETFPGYDLRFFDHLGDMRDALDLREQEAGLARLVAGFAWSWATKRNPEAYDIELDGQRLRWNSTDVDWVSSSNSVNEVGSIHTIQGYDLNYAGVIIGPDLRYDAARSRTTFDRANYKDPRGTTNNRLLGVTYSDEDILKFVRNIYAVLLTRGMLGTYVYVCDPALREHLRRFF